MMKRNLILIAVLMLTAFLIAGCSKTDKGDTASTAGDVTTAPTAAPTVTPEAVSYKDGVYEVKTEPDYEKYYTEATLTVESGKITAFEWTIYDAGRDNIPFDSEYYKVLAEFGDLYEQQGKDDWAGSRGYSDVLIETQDINQVDAVSGATWTNRKFKEILRLALEQAKN